MKRAAHLKDHTRTVFDSQKGQGDAGLLTAAHRKSVAQRKFDPGASGEGLHVVNRVLQYDNLHKDEKQLMEPWKSFESNALMATCLRSLSL